MIKFYYFYIACRYPTDNDKQMLAKQTGLTRNQVTNISFNLKYIDLIYIMFLKLNYVLDKMFLT